MGSRTRQSISYVERKLTAAPILRGDEGNYYLDTDASDVGLGAVLSQDQDGQEVVLAMRPEFFQAQNETMM